MRFQVHRFGRCLVGVVLLLELDRAGVAEPFLDAAGGVEAVEVLEEREVHLGPGREDAAAEALGLDQHPQVLRQGIVERVAGRARGCLDSRSDQARRELDAPPQAGAPPAADADAFALQGGVHAG
nr:hypothetical protein [Streptomyces sp. M2CJ-2]